MFRCSQPSSSCPVLSPLLATVACPSRVSPQHVQLLFVQHVWLCSTAADTGAISLHDNCQCVHSGWFIVAESRGLPEQRRLSITLGVSGRWPEADSFPICKLSLFIYLLLNDPRFKPRGHFLFFFSRLWKKRKQQHRGHFSCWSFVTGPSKSRTGVTLNGKFSPHLRWMPLKVYPLIPISARVIHALSDTHTHTLSVPLPIHLLPPPPPSLLQPCFNQSNANPSQHYGLG